MEERRLRGNLIKVFKYLKDDFKDDTDKLFFVSVGYRTRSIGFKLQQGTFRLEIRKNF